MNTKLLSISADYKTKKGEKQGYLTGIIYLSPSNLSGKDLCPFASKGCRKACLYTAGRGCFNNVKQARMNRTRLYLDNRHEFFKQLIAEIKKLENKANRKGLIPVVRLNGTSDIPFELMKIGEFDNIMAIFPHIQFYDYTKNPHRFKKELPKNYDLTFSRSEENDHIIEKFLDLLPKIAVVFKSEKYPLKYLGKHVIYGDETDLRFLDPKECIVGLTAKGKARKDTSGFVVGV